MRIRRLSNRKRRHIKAFTTVSILTLCSTYTAAVLLWPLQQITPTDVVRTKTIPAEATTSWPTNYSAIGSTRHGVLAASDTTTQIPIASITKLITALVILDAKPLKQGEAGPAITFTAEDSARYNQYIAMDGTVGNVIVGQQITQYQLLQGMLLSSANNYADTAAVWAYGSMDTYLQAAAAYLTKHGYTQTTVADATGFSPNSKSTAPEAVKIGIRAINEPILAGIVQQKTAIVPGLGTFTNTNRLLGTQGIVGLKTGTTDEAGSCLLFASQFTTDGTPTTLVGVVLGAPNHANLFQSVAALTEQTTSQYGNRVLAKSGDIYATYETPWGTTAHATSPKITQVAWTGTPANITTTTAAITPDNNQQPGRLISTIGSQQNTADLTLDTPLTGPSWTWRLTHPQYIFGLK